MTDGVVGLPVVLVVARLRFVGEVVTEAVDCDLVLGELGVCEKLFEVVEGGLGGGDVEPKLALEGVGVEGRALPSKGDSGSAER